MGNFLHEQFTFNEVMMTSDLSYYLCM